MITKTSRDSDSHSQSGLYPLPPGVLLTSKLCMGGEIFPDQPLVVVVLHLPGNLDTSRLEFP